jgi:hypothetical protein
MYAGVDAFLGLSTRFFAEKPTHVAIQERAALMSIKRAATVTSPYFAGVCRRNFRREAS